MNSRCVTKGLAVLHLLVFCRTRKDFWLSKQKGKGESRDLQELKFKVKSQENKSDGTEERREV
jgi:hypothetical protein